jgi:hypothetical protein
MEIFLAQRAANPWLRLAQVSPLFLAWPQIN